MKLRNHQGGLVKGTVSLSPGLCQRPAGSHAAPGPTCFQGLPELHPAWRMHRRLLSLPRLWAPQAVSSFLLLATIPITLHSAPAGI